MQTIARIWATFPGKDMLRNEAKFFLQRTYEPVNPVEKWSQMMIRWTSHECQKGLDETKTHSDKANNCVWVWANSFRKALKLKYDENKASNCESPGQHHEVSVPYEPLVKIETSFWCPGLLEISVEKASLSFLEAFWIFLFSPGHNDSQTGWADPGSYHKCSVEEDEHSWFWLECSDLSQSLSRAWHDLVAVMLLDVPGPIHPALGQHHMILLILQVPDASFCNWQMC